MNATENRRKRLKEFFEGKKLPHEEKSYLSQLMTGKSSFGEKAARRLEADYGMGQGYLDQAADGYIVQKDGTVWAFEVKSHANEEPDNTPREDEFTLIPQLDVHASCGPGGKFHDHIVVKGGLAFKRTFLGEMQVSEKHARIIHAEGPSMEPTIGHGRVVLINTADNTPQDGRVFLICDEDGGMILKRLVREFEPSMGATVWKIRSDNPDKRKYPDKFWPEDTRACIVGRAIWHDGLL